uniref:Thioredoxin domain-containing protein n=1 Tax=Echinostoma caproni TaxID=27848 RepID=A0A183AZB4_9TREM
LIIPSAFGVERLLQAAPRSRQPASISQSIPGQSVRLTKTTTHDCYLLFLYSLDCRFSYDFFPHVRALARAYPQFRVYAVRIEDYMTHRWSLRTLYVPKLKLMVDGRVLREYADSEFDFDALIDFVWTNTRKGSVTCFRY